MANQLCSQAQLRCRLEVPDLPTQAALSSHVRHNLIMAVKEALHNVIKHARASEVRLRIAFAGAQDQGAVAPAAGTATDLNICILDDGCGFNPEARPLGNGLANLKRRMEDIGGSFVLESKLAVGTTVTLCLPVAKTATGTA